MGSLPEPLFRSLGNAVLCSAYPWLDFWFIRRAARCIHLTCVCIAFSQGNTLPHHAIGSLNRLSSMRNKQLQATVLSVAQVKENVGLVYVNTASLIIQLLYFTFPLSDFEIFLVLKSSLLYFCISTYFCSIFPYSLSGNLSRPAEHALIAWI